MVTFAGLLVAALLAMSALTKIRMDRRTGMGTSPATLLELTTAVIVVVVPALSGALPVHLVALAFVVSVTASGIQLRRYGRERRRREASEGGRLAAYVRYLSAADEASEGPAEGADPPHGPSSGTTDARRSGDEPEERGP